MNALRAITPFPRKVRVAAESAAPAAAFFTLSIKTYADFTNPAAAQILIFPRGRVIDRGFAASFTIRNSARHEMLPFPSYLLPADPGVSGWSEGANPSMFLTRD
jgi:hypothetical protein